MKRRLEAIVGWLDHRTGIHTALRRALYEEIPGSSGWRQVFGHIYLVRKHGVTPVPADENLPAKHFHPGQTFKDTVAIFVAFAILFTMAVAVRVPLEQLADPSDTTYIPRPEWYFLFLFQTLKLFSGPLEVLGAVVLPGLAVLALILVPFIDRGRMVKVTRRVTAFAFVALAAIGWTGLTATAIITTPHPDQAAQIDYSGPPSGCNSRRRN